MLIGTILLALVACGSRAGTLTVGPGQMFERPEQALRAASEGDTIELRAPGEDELVLTGVALRITTPRITLRAAGRVVLEGGGFDYSGEGSVPRAIVQVEPGGRGAVVQGFVLRGAHNASGNGAGVRINAADDVTVRACEIRGCDMGIMSNGAAGQGMNQRFESCIVEANGSERAPGLSHNLYLGGEGATLEGCTVRGSTTGHNLKSRARKLSASRCEISGSANREIDLVDSDLTEQGADANFEACMIAKRAECPGNRGVIHFGRDGEHARSGRLVLKNCRIVTYSISPVVMLSSPGVTCAMEGCRIENPAQKNAVLAAWADGKRVNGLANAGCRIDACFGEDATEAPGAR